MYDIVSVCVMCLCVCVYVACVLYVLCVCVCVVCYVFVYASVSLILLCFFAFVDPLFEELGILTDLSCCFHYNIFYCHLLIVKYIILL